MNEAIQNMIDDLKSFEQSKDEIIIDLVRDNEKAVLQMNVDQLYSGIDAEGKEISPAYKPSTVKRKRRKGDPYDRVTTRDEGDHHESIFAEYRNDEFELDAADFKKKYLVKKYGEHLYGLTEQNIDKLITLIRDPFIEVARRKIFN